MTAAKATTLPPASIRITTDAWTEPYWEAAKDERLVAPRCTSCGAFRFPPTPFCPECRSQATEWITLAGEATLFSFSVVRGFPGLPDVVVVPVVVEFAEAPGVHIVSNLIEVDPERVEIGMRLDVGFIPIADGWKLPVFRAAS